MHLHLEAFLYIWSFSFYLINDVSKKISLLRLSWSNQYILIYRSDLYSSFS